MLIVTLLLVIATLFFVIVNLLITIVPLSYNCDCEFNSEL